MKIRGQCGESLSVIFPIRWRIKNKTQGLLLSWLPEDETRCPNGSEVQYKLQGDPSGGGVPRPSITALFRAQSKHDRLIGYYYY